MARLMGMVVCVVVLVTGCSTSATDVPFSLSVTPESITDSIPNERCVILATVDIEGASAVPATILATAEGATVTVEHAQVLEGEVAEIMVVPRPLEAQAEQLAPDGGGDEGRQVEVTVTATLGGETRTATVPITVTSEEEDGVGPDAAPVRGLFVSWLAENHPELGITAETEWTGTITRPRILVVTHYLYYSEEWEMHVYWHVMIPPYDWATVELRRRFEETAYSLAFHSDSRSADPVAIAASEPEFELYH